MKSPGICHFTCCLILELKWRLSFPLSVSHLDPRKSVGSILSRFSSNGGKMATQASLWSRFESSRIGGTECLSVSAVASHGLWLLIPCLWTAHCARRIWSCHWQPWVSGCLYLQHSSRLHWCTQIASAGRSSFPKKNCNDVNRRQVLRLLKAIEKQIILYRRVVCWLPG